MERLRDIMKTPVITIEPHEHVGRARTRMEWAGVHHLPVVADGKLVGIIALTDVQKSRRWADRVEEEEPWTDEMPIERIMSSPAIALAPDASIAQAVLVLRRRAIGCVPIVDDGKVVGIVTRTDLQPVLERVFSDRASSESPPAAPPESTVSPKRRHTPRGLQR